LEKNRAGTTIILVTHNVLEAEKVIQRVGIINQGKIMALGDVGELKARVDQRMRLELLLYRNGESTNNITLQFLETITGGEVLQQGSNHYIVLVERHRLEEVIGLVISTVGMDNLNDFRILTPSLEDVYMQLGGGKDLVTAN
jgi:ABC-type multidrug transport system ATPase subunit